MSTVGLDRALSVSSQKRYIGSARLDISSITFAFRYGDKRVHQSESGDGEVYCNIRSCKSEEVEGWIFKLSPCKQVGLRQLLKRDDFTYFFDRLLPFIGLWVGFELGNIQRLLALHCDEVVSFQLYHPSCLIECRKLYAISNTLEPYGRKSRSIFTLRTRLILKLSRRYNVFAPVAAMLTENS